MIRTVLLVLVIIPYDGFIFGSYFEFLSYLRASLFVPALLRVVFASPCLASSTPVILHGDAQRARPASDLQAVSDFHPRSEIPSSDHPAPTPSGSVLRLVPTI